jgi:hypothetical protein
MSHFSRKKPLEIKAQNGVSPERARSRSVALSFQPPMVGPSDETFHKSFLARESSSLFQAVVASS